MIKGVCVIDWLPDSRDAFVEQKRKVNTQVSDLDVNTQPR
jgi:hypothetical protein